MTETLGIQIQSLTKKFSQKEVIKNLNLSIEPGSFVSILGPSGCGKSTLLRLIAGIETPSSGILKLTATEGKANFSFVFQDSNLLPWRTVQENVLLPFELNQQLQKLSETEKLERVNDALKKVKLQDAAKLFPHELSGGMKMRVSLARALVNSPRLLLMDEPFAALDETTRYEMQNQLRALWSEEKMTVVFVTHSLLESAYLSERIVMLKGSGAQVVLDQKLDLPEKRDDRLRTSESFNKIVRDISVRLRQ